MIVGGGVLAFFVAIAGFVSYAAYQGRALDTSSREFIEQSIPRIISTWSKDELLNRSSTQMLEAVRTNPQELDRLFLHFSKLGSLVSMDEVRGDSHVAYTTRDGKVTTAFYVVKARFENGNAEISVRLIQSNGDWQLLSFSVKPDFIKAAHPARVTLFTIRNARVASDCGLSNSGVQLQSYAQGRFRLYT